MYYNNVIKTVANWETSKFKFKLYTKLDKRNVLHRPRERWKQRRGWPLFSILFSAYNADMQDVIEFFL